jgi:surface antigen
MSSVRFIVVGAALIALFSSFAAHSINLRWLENSPVRFFTEQDWRMSEETTDRALNTAGVGETLNWENPRSGNSGGVSVISEQEREGRNCRTLGIQHQARGMTRNSRHLFCRHLDGEWKIETMSQ